MSVTRKVLDLAAHDTSAVVHSWLHSLADDVAELERERDRYRAQVARVEELLDAESPYGEDVPSKWLRAAVQGNDWRTQ